MHEASVKPLEPPYRPASHGPLQSDVVMPDDDPYRPTAHGPLQLTLPNALLPPYKPAAQLEQLLALPTLYVPDAHGYCVPFAVPKGHMYPAGQGFRAYTALPAGQKYPALHAAVHVAVDSAAVEPYWPAGHGVQSDAPTVLYEPGLQAYAVPAEVPGGQRYPAGHGTAVPFVDPLGQYDPASPTHTANPSHHPNQRDQS